jgi:hypothetical protein
MECAWTFNRKLKAPPRGPISPGTIAVRHAAMSIRGLRARHRRESETRSCPSRQQRAARHPHVGQREQGHELRGVLSQPSIEDLGVTELPLDDPERMLDLGPDACLDSLDLINGKQSFNGVYHVRP